MRKIKNSNENSNVVAADAPGIANAHHEYYIGRVDSPSDIPVGEFGFVRFQNGPVQEAGVNGCHHEDLLAILIHRLQCFQMGDFNCRENALALTKLQEALHWLEARTKDRVERGVEGTTVL